MTTRVAEIIIITVLIAHLLTGKFSVYGRSNMSRKTNEWILRTVVTQCVGDARLDARHPHVADPVLMFGFHQHSDFYVPQSLHSNLQPITTEFNNTWLQILTSSSCYLGPWTLLSTALLMQISLFYWEKVDILVQWVKLIKFPALYPKSSLLILPHIEVIQNVDLNTCLLQGFYVFQLVYNIYSREKI